MQTFLDFGSGFLTWLWRASWQASVLILLVLSAQWLLRKHLSPRARHALWLLVLVRLLLPWSVESRLSVFNLVPTTAVSWVSTIGAPPLKPAPTAPSSPESAEESAPEYKATATEPRSPAVSLSWTKIVVLAWLAGVFALPLFLLVSNLKLGFTVRRQRPLTDTAVLNLLEDCKETMGVRTPLTLVETPATNCPALLGFVRPRLLLPAGFTAKFSRDEMRYVFLHELGHIKRGDIALNWLAAIPLMVHWFNPFVWFAFNRMRADGEVACDALALRHTGTGENQSYGQTIIKLLESFSRPAVGPGMVGILENKNLMKRRISMIAKFNKTHRWPVVAGAAFAALALVALTDAQSAPRGGPADNGADAKGPPRIVSTSPEVGATDVDPSVSEITVTFDRDMQEGCSWTGGGPEFPPGQPGKKPVWKDKRTCSLPVKLDKAKFYRVGINSTSYRNFKSAEGVSVQPSAIYFTTKGASDALKAKASVPKIVALVPRNGADDVDPNLKEIRVTFSVPMGAGCSWTGGGENFPTIPEGKKIHWTEDKKTCVMPVELKPGWEYHLGINSPSHRNFQSAGGVPLEPVKYSFKTK